MNQLKRIFGQPISTVTGQPIQEGLDPRIGNYLARTQAGLGALGQNVLNNIAPWRSQESQSMLPLPGESKRNYLSYLRDMEGSVMGETLPWRLAQIDDIYHGSPHKYIKVDMSKVGTGEGHRAFGWGWYGTDTRDVTGVYKISKTERTPWFLRTKAERDIKEFPEGNVYTATLFHGKKPSEYTLLDWYEKIPDEVTTKILERLKKENVTHFSGAGMKVPAREATMSSWQTNDLYRILESTFGSDKKASEFLSRAGISGIRYPTGTLSGMKGKGGYNYVIFDEKDIKLLKRESGGMVEDIKP